MYPREWVLYGGSWAHRYDREPCAITKLMKTGGL